MLVLKPNYKLFELQTFWSLLYVIGYINLTGVIVSVFASVSLHTTKVSLKRRFGEIGTRYLK